MNTTKIKVAGHETGETLLSFLAGKLDISNSKAKTLLDSRDVFINKKRVWIAKHTLQSGDNVEIISRTSIPSQTKLADILFHDNYYIVVNKRPGILSNGDNSVESCMRKELNTPSILSVHRLDVDTTGCLLLAKNRQAFEKAIPLFKEHLVEKSYHAIVTGKITPAQQTIKREIDGKHAVTSIKALDTNREASHVAVKIKTGRTHQIRKHLASIKHYVLGDKHYGIGHKGDKKTMQIGRQMLHASSLKFTHPYTGKNINMRAPLPPDFRKCLKLFNLK